MHCETKETKKITLQSHHVDSTLKRRGSDPFHVVLTWNPRGVFIGKAGSRRMGLRFFPMNFHDCIFIYVEPKCVHAVILDHL